MAVSLRTRLFLTVGAVLALAIAASSVLSRQATLVEVREFVKQTVPAEEDAGIDAVGGQVEQAWRARTGRGVDGLLEAYEEEHGRPLILIDRDGRVVGGSKPSLRGARVVRTGPQGDVALEIDTNGARSMVAVRGAPTYAVREADGTTAGVLIALPPGDVHERAAPSRPFPAMWAVTSVLVALLALGLTYALARRILEPVQALTAAARRMATGDLQARVAVAGGDEIAGLADAFNAMAARLEQDERLRRQMVGDVAHELRSPVTNLRCTLEAMQDGLTPADRAGIDALHEEALFLQRLIADLQDLALAEAGQLTMHVQEVDVGALIQRAVAAFASRPGPRIVNAAPAVLPAVQADPDRLDQVLRNLLLNARQHTPADGTITVSAESSGEGLRLTVTDTGEGITVDHLPHVFDRFYRADRSRSRATGGAGLGLAIARQIVLAHGGRIAAESPGVGRGATIAIVLPRGNPGR